MSDEPKQPDGTTEAATGTAPEAETPKSQEKVFTAKEVEGIVRDRLARANKSREKSEPEAQPKKDEAKPAGDFSDVREKVEFLEALEDLTDTIDWKPSREDRVLLRTMFKSGGAEQMAALAERLKGPGTKPGTSAPSTAAPAHVAATYQPPPGAPSSPADVIENNPAKWDPAYIERLKRDGTFRQRVEEFHQSGQGGLFRKQTPKGT